MMFAPDEHSPLMDLVTFRRKRDLSQERLASSVGLRSKGHVSDIESGLVKPSIKTALRIEAFSEGAVAAETLVAPADAALLATHRRLATVQSAETAA